MKKTLLILFSILSIFSHAQTTLNWERSVPLAFNPVSQTSQWADVAPDMQLPSGHIYVNIASKKGWTQDLIFRKGVTHWTQGAVEDEGGNDAMRARFPTKMYNNVPRTEGMMGLYDAGPDADGGGYNLKWWPNGPFNEQKAREVGQTRDITPRLWIGENMEGSSYMPYDKPMWGWFYEELIKRFENQKAQDGIPYYVAHNYYWLFGGVDGMPNPYSLGEATAAQHKALYSTDPSIWQPKTAFHNGNTLSKTNLVVLGVYMNVPDLTPDAVFADLHRMEFIKKLGKSAGIFLFGVHEWRPNWGWGIRYPEGTLIRKDKLRLDPNFHMAYAFFAQEYGHVFVEWGVVPHQVASKAPLDEYPGIMAGGDFWYPNGQTVAQPGFPHYGAYNAPNKFNFGGGDWSHWGTFLWQKTFGQVASGSPYYCKFRLNNGSWVEREANGADVVDAYFQKRGIVRCRISGNKIAIMYYNPYADNTRRTIEIQDPVDPSRTYTTTVCGNGIHATLINR